MNFVPQVDYTDEQMTAVTEFAQKRMVDIMTTADKTERATAEGDLRTEMLEALLPRFAEVRPGQRREAAQSGVPVVEQGDGPSPDRARGRSYRRSGTDRTPSRCPPRWRCCPGSTAPGCSSAARPRCSTSPRSAWDAWTR